MINNDVKIEWEVANKSLDNKHCEICNKTASETELKVFHKNSEDDKNTHELGPMHIDLCFDCASKSNGVVVVEVKI